MNKLPESCLLHIFEYLHPKDWTSISQVCVQWNHLAKTLWEDCEVYGKYELDIFHENLETITQKKIINIIKHYGKLFKRLTLRPYNSVHCYYMETFFAPIKFGRHVYIVIFNSEEDIYDVYKQLLITCCNITHLRISDTVPISLPNLINMNKELKSFLCSTDFIIPFHDYEHLPKSLEELSIHSSEINKDNFTSFLQNHTVMRDLTLEIFSDPNDFTLNEIIEILSNYTTQLEFLSLGDTGHLKYEITIPSVKLLSNFVYLKKLHIDGKFTITKEMVLILRNCKAITDIKFCCCILCTEVLTEITKFPKLEALSLGLVKMKEELQLNPSGILNNLQILSFNCANYLNQNSVIAALDKMPVLSTFQYDTITLENIYKIIIWAASSVKQIVIKWDNISPFQKTGAKIKTRIRISKIDSSMVRVNRTFIIKVNRLMLGELLVKIQKKSVDLPGLEFVVDNDDNLDHNIDCAISKIIGARPTFFMRIKYNFLKFCNKLMNIFKE